MLQYFRRVEETGEELLVTSHRRPVLKVSRLDHVHTVEELFGALRGKVNIPDSVVEPETEEWGEV
jgi:predicted nicotinamide N-methyase